MKKEGKLLNFTAAKSKAAQKKIMV